MRCTRGKETKFWGVGGLPPFCWTYIDPGVIEHLGRRVSQLRLHLQHPVDQSLQRHVLVYWFWCFTLRWHTHTWGENNKPWPGQKHCPSTLKGNPAGRSECVQTDPPDLYHRWRNTNNTDQRCVTAFCTSRLRLLVCQQDYVKATGAVGPRWRNGPSESHSASSSTVVKTSTSSWWRSSYVPTERRKPTQQDVRDDPSGPDVDLEAISVIEEENNQLSETKQFCEDTECPERTRLLWLLTPSPPRSLEPRRWGCHTQCRGARSRWWPNRSPRASEIYCHRRARRPERHTHTVRGGGQESHQVRNDVPQCG